MTRSELFTAAHKLAKTLVATLKTYKAAFSAALKQVYSQLKNKVMEVKEITTKEEAIEKYLSLKEQAQAILEGFTAKNQNTRLVLDIFTWEFKEMNVIACAGNHVAINEKSLKNWEKRAIRDINDFGVIYK